MRVLQVRNVHVALPQALQLLEQIGVRRESRNGPVLVAYCPVTTIYERPCERVMFWKDRDANPFFHLYEALWMLDGRDDVAPLERYVKKSIDYSDDGETLWGAYGYRWRKWFKKPYSENLDYDQLAVIADRLRTDPTDRRCVLQMWSAEDDLGRKGKDVPCNTIATFQRGIEGELNLVVFNRSNDIIWGCYGANAVQFSFLLEYMAAWISCPIGTYTQVSVNWHAYDNEVWKQVSGIRPDRVGYIGNPYEGGYIHHIPMKSEIEIGRQIKILLEMADTGIWGDATTSSPWTKMVYHVLKAHHLFKNLEAPLRYTEALKELNNADHEADWVVAAGEWILRRYKTWVAKQELIAGDLSHP